MISIQPDEQGGAFQVDISIQSGSDIDRLAYMIWLIAIYGIKV